MIKRGVSLYSYQQEQFFKRMTLRDMVKEVHDNLHTDGIEIIDESVIRQYPNPSDEFVAEFRDLMDEFQMNAVTMDVNVDPLLYRDHVMTHKECAERLIGDIKLGARLGFKNLRLCGVPIDAMEMAVSAAEDYNVCIGKEVHAPFTIKPEDEDDIPRFMPQQPRYCAEVIELAERKNTKHVGLIPDMGLFQYRIAGPHFAFLVREGANPYALRAVDRLAGLGMRDPRVAFRELCAMGFSEADSQTASVLVAQGSDVVPQDLLDIIPYILSIHGKFYEMTEIPGREGEYEDVSIDYYTPFYYLKKGGYDGYINSEYEGQRDQQDRGMEYLADEVKEVRRHHEMMQRLIDLPLE